MNTLDVANIVMPLLLAAVAVWGTLTVKKALNTVKGDQGPRGFTGAMGCMGEPARLINIIRILPDLEHINHQTCVVEHLDGYIIQGEYWVYIDRSKEDPENNMASDDDGMFHFCGYVDGTPFKENTGPLSYKPDLSRLDFV